MKIFKYNIYPKFYFSKNFDPNTFTNIVLINDPIIKISKRNCLIHNKNKVMGTVNIYDKTSNNFKKIENNYYLYYNNIILGVLDFNNKITLKRFNIMGL